MRGQRPLIWFTIGFLFTLITSLILFSTYVKIEINGDVLLSYTLVSLLVGVIFVGSHRGKTHFGHLPFLLGMVLSFWAGLALFGNLELPTLKKTLWWIIEDPIVKRNLAIVWFAGVFLFVLGLKWIGKNLFFMRFFSKGK